MHHIRLIAALSAVAGLGLLAQLPARAADAVDPAPRAMSALPDGAFQVAGLRFLNGKWVDDLGNVFDDLGSVLRKVDPTQPNALGKLPDSPLPKLPDEPPRGYDRVDDLPPDADAIPGYELPGSKFGDGAGNTGPRTPKEVDANDLPSPPRDVPPPRTPPGSFRGEPTAVARIRPLPPRTANIRRAATVAAEESPQQAPSFWKRNKRTIIGGGVIIGATGIVIGTPLLVDKLDSDGAFD